MIQAPGMFNFPGRFIPDFEALAGRGELSQRWVPRPAVLDDGILLAYVGAGIADSGVAGGDYGQSCLSMIPFCIFGMIAVERYRRRARRLSD
jgi:hypothetical protein